MKTKKITKKAKRLLAAFLAAVILGPQKSMACGTRPSSVSASSRFCFHQSYQWRYHQAHTIHGKCRHLEGDALAATRRHQAESIFALAYTLDNFLLNATEVGITPIFLEYGLIVGQFSLFGLMSSICNCTWLRLNTLSSMV